MKSFTLVFCGIFLTLVLSWSGLVFMTHHQLGGLEPVTEYLDPDTGESLRGEQVYPRVPLGLAEQGKLVYISEGCVYCHTQQVRRKGFGSDYERGWGERQSVPRDYIRQDRVLLGTMRTGPDLMNVGDRPISASKAWHHRHLYDPRAVNTDSIMPPFAFLYEKRKIGKSGPSPNAIELNPEFAPEAGYEIVPTQRAEALVAYLLSLKLGYNLPEAPLE
jgi:cytochrome c oxidase cbb3-type subunit 2